MRMFSQVALVRLPIVQYTMPSISSPARYVRRDTRAESREPTAMPARSNVSVGTLPPMLEM
jgi:hypothetical protein